MTLNEIERQDPFTPHGLGCRCWPHVSQRAAIEAATQAATAEYRAARTLTDCVHEGRNRGWCVRHDYEWRIDSDVCQFMLLCVGSEYPHDTLADKAGCPDCAVALAGMSA